MFSRAWAADFLDLGLATIPENDRVKRPLLSTIEQHILRGTPKEEILRALDKARELMGKSSDPNARVQIGVICWLHKLVEGLEDVEAYCPCAADFREGDVVYLKQDMRVSTGYVAAGKRMIVKSILHTSGVVIGNLVESPWGVIMAPISAISFRALSP